MKTLDKVTTNSTLCGIYYETPARVLATSFFGLIGGMFVAMIGDVALGVPTAVWISMWMATVVVFWLLFSLPARHGYGRARHDIQRAMLKYLEMPKNEQREFPKNTLDMLRTGDYKVLEDFESAAADLASLRPDIRMRDVEVHREVMAQIRSNISITKKTYDELG